MKKMKKMKRVCNLLVTTALMLTITNSYASLSVTFERLSQNEIRVMGNGQIDVDGSTILNRNILYFDNTFESILAGVVNGNMSNVSPSSDLYLGSKLLQQAYTMSEDFDWSGVSSGWYFVGSSSFQMNDTFSTGSVNLTIGSVSSNPVFASAGSSGEIYWGGTGAGPGTGEIVGTWEMVAPSNIPVPTAVWFFGTGVFSLIGFRKRSQKIV